MQLSASLKNVFILMSAMISVLVVVLFFQQGMGHVTNILLAISLISLCVSIVISNQEKSYNTEISELQDTIKGKETDQRFQELRSSFDRDIKEIHDRISMFDSDSSARDRSSEKDIYYAINEIRHDFDNYKKCTSNTLVDMDNKIKYAVSRDIGVGISSSVNPDIS